MELVYARLILDQVAITCDLDPGPDPWGTLHAKGGNDDGENTEHGRVGCLKYGSHLITRGSISVVGGLITQRKS